MRLAKDKVTWWLATAGLGVHRLQQFDTSRESIGRFSKKVIRMQDCDQGDEGYLHVHHHQDTHPDAGPSLGAR